MRHSILRVVCILLALVLVPLWALAEEGADVTVAADSAASYILEGKVFPYLRQWSKDAPMIPWIITNRVIPRPLKKPMKQKRTENG